MEDVRKFGNNIKQKYRERRVIREEQWPPCNSNKLVRLELVEREKGEGYSARVTEQRGGKDETVIKRTPLDYCDLFKVENGKMPVRKVLVEGDAGIGKTTLCLSISKDWANEKLFQQFELVLLLPLRMKAVASAGSLSELLKLLHLSPRLCESVASYLEETEGESVLIVADGWDELSESERQQGSFIYQLLFSSIISVVVTSRPSASAPLHRVPDQVDRFVEVRGFSKQHIVEYIQSQFSSDQEKAGHLLEQLENNPLIESVCSVPLNCTIFCYLWHTLGEPLPITMTNLYTKIILNLVFRNIRKTGTYNSLQSLSKFDSLPADLQQPWWFLCEFAFQTLEKDQLVFSQEELISFLPQDLAYEKIICFGLLQSAESILNTGYGVSFHFLHLTFQEYLAALYIARQPLDKQFEILKAHKQMYPVLNRFAMVWRFFFGIASFLNTCFFNRQIFEFVAGFVQQGRLSACHCAFEAQNDLINDEMAQFLVSQSSESSLASRYRVKVNFGDCHSAHDCTAVLYVMVNMQQCDAIAINFGNCCVREDQITKLIDILTSHEGALQIIDLNLSFSGLTSAGFQALKSAICDDMFTKLKKLDLTESLPSDVGTNISFIETLSTHCPLLQDLNLSNNNLNVSGASVISRMYESSYDGREITLYLTKTSLGDEGLTALIKNFKFTALIHLELACNHIHSTGISSLANAVCLSKVIFVEFNPFCMSTLNLSDNPLGLEGTGAIARIFGSIYFRTCLINLSKCELTTVGGGLPNTNSLNLGNRLTGKIVRYIGHLLCQMPQAPNNMYSLAFHSLRLDGNSFTRDGIHILASFMYLCPGLRILHTNDCEITSDDFISLLDKLTRLKSLSPSICCELRSWYLCNNQIDDTGVSALIDHLPSLFTHLGLSEYGNNIDIDNNPVSSEMIKRLKETVRTSQKASMMDKMKKMHMDIADVALGRKKSVSGDSIESASGTSNCISLSSTPPSLSSSTTKQCAIQKEDHQLQKEGSYSDTTISLDLQPTSSKMHEEDFTSLHLGEVEHRFLALIKWKDTIGVERGGQVRERELRIYSKIAHKWRQIASLLGFEPGEIQSLHETAEYNCNITIVLGRWFENAKNLHGQCQDVPQVMARTNQIVG